MSSSIIELRAQAARLLAEADAKESQAKADAARLLAEQRARLPAAVVNLAQEAILGRKHALLTYYSRDANGEVQKHSTGQEITFTLSHKRDRPRVMLPPHVHAWLHAEGVLAYPEYHERGIHGVAMMWGTTRDALCADVPPKKWYDFLNSARGLSTPYQHTWDAVFRRFRWARRGVMPIDVAAWFGHQA